MFECQEGQSRVHLHHTLHPPPPHQQSHHRHHHQSPSRIRRRARRALARVAATADKSLNDVAPKNVNDSEKSSVPAAAEEETVTVNNEEAIKNGEPNFDDAKNATVVREIDHKACQVMLASQNQATQVLPSPHQVREAAVQNVPHPVVHLPHVPVQKLSILPSPNYLHSSQASISPCHNPSVSVYVRQEA